MKPQAPPSEEAIIARATARAHAYVRAAESPLPHEDNTVHHFPEHRLTGPKTQPVRITVENPNRFKAGAM